MAGTIQMFHLFIYFCFIKRLWRTEHVSACLLLTQLYTMLQIHDNNALSTLICKNTLWMECLKPTACRTAALSLLMNIVLEVVVFQT